MNSQSWAGEISIDDVFIRVRGTVGSLGTCILLPDLPVIVLFRPTKDKLKDRSPLHLAHERSRAWL